MYYLVLCVTCHNYCLFTALASPQSTHAQANEPIAFSTRLDTKYRMLRNTLNSNNCGLERQKVCRLRRHNHSRTYCLMADVRRAACCLTHAITL